MRYRRLVIDGQMLINLLTQGTEHRYAVLIGLPAGTKFIYAIPESVIGVSLVIEHETFELLDNGDPIPIHIPHPELHKL